MDKDVGMWKWTESNATIPAQPGWSAVFERQKVDGTMGVFAYVPVVAWWVGPDRFVCPVLPGVNPVFSETDLLYYEPEETFYALSGTKVGDGEDAHAYFETRAKKAAGGGEPDG